MPLIASIVSVLVIGASLSLKFLELDTYKEQIVAQVRGALKRDLRYASGDFSLRYGPCFTFSDLTVKEKNGVDDFIKADRLVIRIALLPLLRREVVVSRLELERPQLELSRERDGSLNIADLLSSSGGSSPGLRALQLNKARIRFTDRAVAETPLVSELTDADLYLSGLTRGKECDFKLSGKLASGGARVPVSLAGRATLPPAGASFASCQLEGKLRTGPLDAGRFWPYYSRFVPFRSLSGELALEANFKGRPDAFRSKGEFTFSRLKLDYPQVFHALLAPREVKCAYQLELGARDLNVSELKLKVDGLEVKGSCRLSDLRSGDLRITAKAATNRFDLRQFRQYIPYGVIVKDTADFIEQKIQAGFYKLDEGRLDGRVSQILHMERGHNYDILWVKAQVEEGTVDYGSGIPLFSGIKGELYLAGKDFILKGMSGRFGSSPLTLEGRIADYPLDTPTRYLFSAAVRPRQPEALWLLGGGRGGRLSLGEGATLQLSGEGTSKLYNLSGSCDLTKAGYLLPGLIGKPQGRPNSLTFNGSFDKEQFRMNALTYNLAPLALSASASNRYRGGVALELRTNQFQLAEIAPLCPRLKQYQPSGALQAQLSGAGPAMDQLSFTGNLALAGVSLKGVDAVKPISALSGSVKLGADSLESGQLSVRVGSSALSGRAALSGFHSPTVSLSFYSPLLDLADLGFNQGKVPLRVEKVQGSVSWSKEKDTLQIGALSGTLGRSYLQVKGSVRNLKSPQAELSVSSPHLELEDLGQLFAGPSGGGHFSLKANLTASEGRAHEIPFQRLKCLVQLEDKILYLQPLEFAALDGEVSAKMRIDFGSGAPRYQLSCNLQRLSADRLLRTLGAKKQEMTGTVSAQGELSAKGENSLELRKSALGSVKLKVEHGSIRKLSTLSKIFSILNVSQLFKLQLPEMVSGGMPYNKLTGDFAIRDGIAATHNLILDSNAINLSAVGKLDLPRDQLDLSIGVQPLQTVDKVVSHIPIVGWILTGKDHSLITTYFEAKGPIEEPQVTAVPVKSLAKGVFNVFKRVFELPERLITDTGEVVIGK